MVAPDSTVTRQDGIGFAPLRAKNGDGNRGETISPESPLISLTP